MSSLVRVSTLLGFLGSCRQSSLVLTRARRERISRSSASPPLPPPSARGTVTITAISSTPSLHPRESINQRSNRAPCYRRDESCRFPAREIAVSWQRSLFRLTPYIAEPSPRGEASTRKPEDTLHVALATIVPDAARVSARACAGLHRIVKRRSASRSARRLILS